MDLCIYALLLITPLVKLGQAKNANSLSLIYTIPEESPRDTVVAKLSDDVEQMLEGSSTKGFSSTPLRLAVSNWQDAGPRHLSIDPTTGYLVVSVKPNRELLCPDSSSGTRSSSTQSQRVFSIPTSAERKINGPEAADQPCYLNLKVVCTRQTSQDSEFASFDPILITVNVIIKDINDNTPTFPQPRINFELGETSVVGETTIPLPAASDPDAGANATLSYWLEDDRQRVNSNYSIPFSLEGLMDGHPLRLRLTQPLDHEKVKEYDFSLYVEDHGHPNPLKSKLNIHVDVIDENDNAPVFTNPAYFVSINETLPRGSILMEIRAFDADSNRNGQVGLIFCFIKITNHLKIAIHVHSFIHTNAR